MAEIRLDLAPERRLPSVHFQVVGIECCNRHCCRGRDRLIGGNVFGAQIELACRAFTWCVQAVDRKVQVWQHIIVDDVIEKYRVRVKGVLRQDDAVIKGFFVANGSVPGT